MSIAVRNYKKNMEFIYDCVETIISGFDSTFTLILSDGNCATFDFNDDWEYYYE